MTTTITVELGDLVRTRFSAEWRKVTKVDADGVAVRGNAGTWFPLTWLTDVRKPVERVGEGPHCPYCNARWTWEAEAWGNSATCAECGHHDFLSIGD